MSDASGQVADVPLIAVVVDSPIVSRWVSASLAALSQRHPQLRVAVMDVASPQSMWSRVADTAVARALHRRSETADSQDAIDEARLDVVRAKTTDDLDAALRDAGIVVDLSSGLHVRAQGEQIVLSVMHGGVPATSSTALVREFLSGRPTVTTAVLACDAAARCIPVAGARTALARRSLATSRDRVAAKIPALLRRGIDSAARPDAPKIVSAGAAERIGTFTVLTGAARLAREAAQSFVRSRTTTPSYAVAWGTRSPSDPPMQLPRQMHWVDHPRDRFLADPFLARDNGQTFIFVEDFSHLNGYATIGVFEPRDPATSFRTVLDRGTHLSYPFVFRDEGNGDWLMLPEMAAEGRVVLFRSSSFPDEWQEDAVLLDGVSAYDPTLVFRDGRYWLFYASGTTGYSFNDELQLAFSDTLRGPYTPHPWNPIKSDVIGSRPAGRLFEWNGRLIRPAQDSSREYGYAVVFNEVTALTPTSFSEQPIGRLEPDWAPRIRSTHSWDFLDDIVVADAKRLHPKHPTGRFTRAAAS
ncbi:MAG: glucosamine inositolphosphorylceramide transferase family protein [Gaiellaceae bacterium]